MIPSVPKWWKHCWWRRLCEPDNALRHSSMRRRRTGLRLRKLGRNTGGPPGGAPRDEPWKMVIYERLKSWIMICVTVGRIITALMAICFFVMLHSHSDLRFVTMDQRFMLIWCLGCWRVLQTNQFVSINDVMDNHQCQHDGYWWLWINVIPLFEQWVTTHVIPWQWI